MEKNEDRRVKMTKRILKEALIEIMHNKSIHEISIKKICQTADINRSTFYHHYSAPYELYEDIVDDILRDFGEIKDKNKAREFKSGSHYMLSLLTDILTYIEERKDLFIVILGDKGNISVGEKLSNNVLKFIDENEASELAVYCTQFISSGVANIVWLWLNNESRKSPRDVALILTMIIYHGIKKVFSFSKK